MLEKLFFYSSDNIVRMMITAPILYAVVISSIRISGKRSTSQMNNFDWVVTVAMGSLIASGIVFKDVSLVEAMLAMLILLALQYLLTKAVRHSDLLAKFVKASPTLLVRNGEFIEPAMNDERVTRGEVLAAVRAAGIADFGKVAAVVLETDGNMSVLANVCEDSENSTLQSVNG